MPWIRGELEIQGTTCTVDVRGNIRQRVDVNRDDPVNSVRLRTLAFRVSGEIGGGENGSIVFEQNEVDTDPKNTLVRTRLPLKFKECDMLSFSATFDPRDGGEPLDLRTDGPAVRTGYPNQVPARTRSATFSGPSTWSTPSTRTGWRPS
ncbi:hypothetical protein AB0465_02650 [Streptomyces griseoviridis]|uniref:hypothetical protein n=1 Tax=Streptomyces griseoviridis TaxID=45398 RepID=UPI00344D35C8